MNKLTLPYYTVNASSIVGQDIAAFCKLKLNIYIETLADLTLELFKKLNSIEQGYLISLSSSFLKETNAQPYTFGKIYLLLVLDLSGNAQKTMSIFVDDKHRFGDVDIKELATFLYKQGLVDLAMPIFHYSSATDQTNGDCTLLFIQNQMTHSQNRYIKNSDKISTLILCDHELLNNLKPSFNYTKLFDFIRSDQLLNSGISNNCIANDQTEIERHLWRKRAQLYKEFLTLSKKIQEKEYYEVLDWYHHEYEILPLWYKQFGHIIKVLMGKRSFRSLFNDNVKKYKD